MAEYEEKAPGIPGRNPPPPDGPRPEPPKSPPIPKDISEFVVVYAEMHLIAGYINERLKKGWRLRGRLRKKIGSTYYQVMVK